MKKRLIKKACSEAYFDIWVNLDTKTCIQIPRSARCWDLTRRALKTIGHAEIIDEIEKQIADAAAETSPAQD